MVGQGQADDSLLGLPLIEWLLEYNLLFGSR